MRRSRRIPRSVYFLPLVVCLFSPLTLSLLTPPDLWAQTLFGPKQYTLTTSTPQTTSSLVSTTSGPAYLYVQNGAADGTSRLRDATVTVNGVEIVNAQDLGPNVAIVDKPITLLSTNALIVTLTGPVSGTLSVTLERRTASLTSVTPNSAHQGEILTVTIVGTNTHFVQGSTQLFAGPGVSVGGAPSGTFGPVTVVDSTHLTATLTIQPTTVLGPRTLLAKTNGEKAALLNGFTVLAGTPAIAGTTVSTLAGTGSPGSTDGPGSTAQFRLPADVAPRADGSAVVADTGNSKLRQIDPTGTVSTVSLPVTLLLPTGVTIDPFSRTVIADTARCIIRIVNSDNTVTTIGSGTCGFADGAAATAKFKFPRDVVSDATGNLFVADTGNFRVRKIDPQGNVTTVAGAGTFGSSDGPATSATFGLLAGIAAAPDGTVFVSDAVHHKIRQIDPAGNVTTLSGTGVAGFADGAAASAQFGFPTGLTRDSTGNLYLADTLNNLIRRLTPSGMVETIAGTGARGSQDGAGSQATFTLPLGLGLATAAPSRVFVADTFNHKIRAIQVVSPPTVTTLSPTSAVQGDTLTLTITGAHLTGATAVTFLLNGSPDPSITAANLQWNPEGTQLTATVNIALTASLGARVVTVTTPGGTSDATSSSANTLTVLGRITLIPNFQILKVERTGSLTVSLSTPAPAGGLTVTLTSAAPGIATVTSPVTIAAGATSGITTVTAVAPGTTNLTASAPGFASGLAVATVVSNRPPTLAPIGNQTAPLGQTLTFTVTGSDPDGDPISFGVTPLPLPAHASFDRVSGRFTFTPAADQGGTFALTFGVTDGTATASETITITVPAPSPGDLTGVRGRVYNLNNTPLGNVTVTLKATGQTAFTGTDGFFTLTGIPSGRQVMLINGREANLGTFAILAVPVDLIEGVLTQLASPITLPDVDLLAEVPVNPTVTTVVTNPNVPGVQVTIPAGTARNPDGTLFTGKLSINPVPDYGRPESRPPQLQPGMAITLQPAGVRFNPPAPITFPNADGMPPGSELNLWSLSPDTGTFILVGRGAVSADGQEIVTVEGGIRASAWHFFLPPPPIPSGDQANDSNRSPDQCTPCPVGSSVTVHEGGLMVDHTLPGVRSLGVSRSPRLVYSSPTADVRPVIPLDVDLSAQTAVPRRFSAALEVGGVAQGSQVFYDTTSLPGTASRSRLSLQFDGSTLPTGRYPYTAQVFSHYPQAAVGAFLGGQLLLVNNRTSPLGAGWGIDGLQRLRVNPDGTILLTEGDGRIAVFTQGRPLVVESFDLSRSPVFGGVNTSFVAGEVFAQARSALLNLANFGPSGVVPRPVRLGSGLATATAEALAGVDVFVLNPISPELSGTEVGILEQFVQEGGVLLEARNVFSNRPLLLGTLPGPFVGDGTADLTAAGRDSPLARGPFGIVPSPLTTGANGAYATTGFATIIARNDLGPNVLLLQPGTGFTGAGRAVLIGDEEIFASGFITGGSNLFSANRTFFLNTFAFATSAPGFRPPAPAPGVAATYKAPQGDFSTLVKNTDGSFTRTLKDGTRINFDAQGLQTAVVDRNGNTTAYAYDAAGRLMRVTDPVGQVTTLAYDGSGLLQSITDPAGRATTFTHDATGNLTQVTNPDGSRVTYAYDAQHRLITKTDERGNVTRYTYDSAGRLAAVTHPTGEVRQVRSSETQGLADVAAGQGTITNPAPITLSQNVQASLTDGKGNATALTVNRFGAPLRQTDALGRVTQTARDANNLPTQITRPNGSLVTMTYDSRGNLLTSTEQAISATTTFTYVSLFNQVTSVTDPRGNRTTLTYDARGNPTTITDAFGNVTTMTYDARGLLTSTRDALSNTTSFTYDAKGNLTTTTDPLGRVTSLSYDAAGNVLTSTDALGRLTTFTYDPLNRLATVTDAAGGVTRYAYDAKGNLTGVTDARGQSTTFAYTAVNQLAQTTNSLGQAKSFTYDLARNLTLTVDAKGQRLESTYDAGNQLTQKVLKEAGGAATDTVTFAYDLLGNLASVADTDSALTFSHDALGRLTQVVTGATVAQPATTLSYAYDKTGNRVTMTDPQAAVTSYVYDALNRLTSLASPQGTTSFAYDALSRRTSLTLPNGSRATSTYDAASQLTRLLNQGPGPTPTTIADFAYTYDPVGNRSTRTALNGPSSYAYDALNRLTQAVQPDPVDPLRQVTESFVYDPVGNRTASHRATGQLHDAANQLLADSNFTYTYDANGNLTSKTSKATGETTSYTYDIENQLIAVSRPGMTATYRYDPLGRRIEKNVNGVATRYVYDSEDILLELDGANVIQARYTHGLGIDEPLAVFRAGVGGGTFFYHPDGLGSVTTLTDSTGTVAQSYTYDSFGNLLASPGSVSQPYTFTGRELDPETGLYYYRARYYDPSMGRFLQEDSIRFLGGLNFYAYVFNSPTNFADPLGAQAVPLPLPLPFPFPPIPLQPINLTPEQTADFLNFLKLFDPRPLGQFLLSELLDKINRGERITPEDIEKARREQEQILKQCRLETGTAPQFPSPDPNQPPQDPKLKWKFIIAQLLKWLSQHLPH